MPLVLQTQKLILQITQRFPSNSPLNPWKIIQVKKQVLWGPFFKEEHWDPRSLKNWVQNTQAAGSFVGPRGTVSCSVCSISASVSVPLRVSFQSHPWPECLPAQTPSTRHPEISCHLVRCYRPPWTRKWQPTLAWEVPWTEEPGGLPSTGSQKWASNNSVIFHMSLPHLLVKCILRNCIVFCYLGWNYLWPPFATGCFWSTVYSVRLLRPVAVLPRPVWS